MAKYGRIAVEGKDIPEDEPLFLIRGQDVTAVEAIYAYAAVLFNHLTGAGLSHNEAQLACYPIDAYADEVAAWQAAHPDRVKVPD